jgi:hypothetical protein
MAVRRNHNELFVEPCPLTVGGINDYQWPYIARRVPYVQKIEETYNIGWRSIPWENNSDVLKKVVETHSPLHTWAASFHVNTFHAVKKIFKKNCLTISINYAENDFEFMQTKWVRWQIGLIMQNNKYSQFKKRFSSIKELEKYLISHGSAEFGYELPKSKKSMADIEISLPDLFHKSRLEEILNYLNTQPTSDDWDFYKRYCQASS